MYLINHCHRIDNISFKRKETVEINKLKRQPENDFGHMLPYYKTEK